jgi:hypothetical protein
MSLKSADIKKKLKEITGIAAGIWSRWGRYKVGSPTDMNPPEHAYESFMKGLRFGEIYPQYQGLYVRLYGASGCEVGDFRSVAVFEQDGEIAYIIDLQKDGTDGMLSPTGSPEHWNSIWPL